MAEPSLVERLRGARIVQVSVVYLGACWFVLQFVNTLQEMLFLPAWIGPVTVGLLAVGLVVVAATAWVQSRAETTAAEEAGEVPTDWEIAPADAVQSLRAGRIPHLTWGRAILGGVVSISLAIGAAGAYVLVRGGGGVLGPTPAGATAAPAGVAVMPFTVRGAGLDEFGEGMVSLVSMNIDGVDGIRSVNPRTVMAAWERADDGTARSLDDVLAVAASTSARFAVVGDAVSVGNRVRFTAELYDLETRESVGEGGAEGPIEDVLPLIDDMSIDLLRTLVARSGSQSATGIQRLEGLVTSSIEALTAYLEGEALFRSGQTSQSLEAYERAVAADSTFALAWSRIASVVGWINIGSPLLREARQQAMTHIDRLPAREATLIRGYSDASAGGTSPGVRQALHTHVQRFPDDPEGWAVLGEHLLHAGGPPVGDEVARALLTPIDLDPGFAPYYVHALRYLVATGDWRFFEYMELYRMLVSEERADRYQFQWDFHFGGDEARARAEAYYDAEPASAFNTLAETYLRADTTAERSLELVRHTALEAPARDVIVVQILASLGRYGDFPPEVGTLNTLVQAFARGGLAIILDESVDGVEPAAGVALLAAAVERFAADESFIPDAAFRGDVASELRVVASAARLLVANQPAEALAALEEIGRPGPVAAALSWWPMMHAEALARSGSERAAVDMYEENPIQWRALTRLRLGELYEATGDVERGRESFNGFLRLFSAADDDMAPLIERARAGLARVGG